MTDLVTSALSPAVSRRADLERVGVRLKGADNPLSKTTRNEAIAALLSSGSATPTEVAEHFGITRERVRQIANAQGVVIRVASADPLVVMRVVRRPSVRSWKMLATACHHADVKDMVRELGLFDAVTRLFRWRESARRRARAARVVAVYRAESARLGRPLSSEEILALRPCAKFIFGSHCVAKLRTLVDERVASNGRRYARHGDVRRAILTLAATKDGCTAKRAAALAGTTRGSACATIANMIEDGLIYNATGRCGSRESVYRLSAPSSPDTEQP